MLTTISKCLAVFTAVASLLFLGAAVISWAAGPNWVGDVHDLDEFTFTENIAETGTTWALKSRHDAAYSPPNGTLPAMVVAARKKLKEDQDARVTELDRQIQAETSRLAQAKANIAIDLKAIDARIDQLTTDLDAIQQQIIVQTIAGTKLAEEISEVQADTETRREEVFRLEAKLDELRADKFRAIEQQRRLVDLLARVSGNIDRVERRNQQLRTRLKKPYDPPPAQAGGE